LILGIKNSKYPIFKVLFLLGVRPLTVISKSVLKGVFIVERWRKEYNQIRPHSSLGYRPPAPEAIYPTIQQFDKSLVN